MRMPVGAGKGKYEIEFWLKVRVGSMGGHPRREGGAKPPRTLTDGVEERRERGDR